MRKLKYQSVILNSLLQRTLLLQKLTPLFCCIEVNPDLEPSICLFILNSSHSQITDLIKLNRNERWQTGRRLCNCFPKEAGACPGGAFFSDALWTENTFFPKSLSQEDGLKEVKNCFRCLFHSFYFICSELLLFWAQQKNWVTFSCSYIFIWELSSGLDFMLKHFIQKDEDWDRELFAGIWVCLWDQAQSYSCHSTVMHRVDFFIRVMLYCCMLQILAVSLKK